MRRLFFCVLLVLGVNCTLAQAQPFILSERVGETIDADERAYFGLFPNCVTFASTFEYQWRTNTWVSKPSAVCSRAT